MSTYDAAIIGGGPAGCSAGLSLARLGARVVLCEAKTYPHHKVCGEFLSPECEHLLDDLGVWPAIRAVRPPAITNFRITAPDRSTWETKLPGTAWGVSRSRLDNLLAQHACTAGVDLREATTVMAAQGNLQEGFELEARTATGRGVIRARTVIAAQGKRSLIDRALKRRFLSVSQPYIGLKAHFEGPPLPGRIELHTFRGGYCGMSEVENGATNVCLLVQSAAYQRAGGTDLNGVAQFIEWMKAQNSSLQSWLESAQMTDERWHSIGQVPFIDKEPVERDMLMVGDAAGLIAPLAGDGIAMALSSGTSAAHTVAEYLEGRLGAEEMKSSYAAYWSREFGARIGLGRFLQGLMFQPRSVSLALRVFRTIPALGDYLVKRTRDMTLIEQGPLAS